MDSQESNRQEISQFFGLVSENDISRFDGPPGRFIALTNLNGSVPGEIRTRKGVEPATTFTGTPTAYDILSMWAYVSPLGPTVITHDSNGDVKARRGSASTTIATGMSTAVPLRFAVTRDNQLIFVNGLQRGKIWPGSNAAALNLGIDVPSQTLTSALAATGGLSAGTYLVGYRYRSEDTLRTDPVYSEMSTLVSYTATDGQRFTHDLTTADNPTGRGTYIEVWRTTVGQSSVLYYVGEDDLASASAAMADTLTDQALIDAAAADPNKVIPIRGRYGVVARRFTPPPKNKGAICTWKDRTWFAVDVPYETGTVSTTSADATLTGSGTTWTSDFVGRFVYIADAVRPYKILSFTNSTSVELTPTPAESLAGKTYKILPDPAERNQLLYSALDESESVHATFAIRVQAVPEDSGDDTALMPFGGSLFIFRPNHAYAFSFSKEPNYDGSSQHAFARGCLNQACWSIHQGVAYVMDRHGAYAVGPGGAVEPISDVIQSYWRDGVIDFDKAKWFHVAVSASENVVRFFVNYTTDTTATRPCRALTYHLIHKVWGEEVWQNEWASAIRLDVDGDPKTIVGGKADRLFFLSSGELDGTTADKIGTVTGATSTTLTNTSGAFGSSSELVGASVAIYDGVGFGQARRIVSHTSTALTVDRAWTTTPQASLSSYVVGGVPYGFRMAYQPILDQARKEIENTAFHLTVAPIEDNLPLHVREWFDFDDAAATKVSGSTSPDRLVLSDTNGTDREVAIHSEAKLNDAGEGVNRGRYTLFSYGKSGGSRLQGKSHVAVEIEGVKGQDAIVLHRVAISGTGK